MRVVRINAVYGLASTGRTVKQLDEGLKEYGVDSTTVYFAGKGSERDFCMSSPASVKLHSAMARLTGKAGYYSAHSTRRLIKYLEGEKPDIVHLHNLHSNFISLPLLFSYLAHRGIPAAVTLHDCWWFTGKCTHYTEAGCNRWQEACGNCPRLKKDIPSLFFDRTEKLLKDKQGFFAAVRPLAVIGVSDWITNEAKKSILGDADIIKRVYNWIDTDIFKPTPSDFRERYAVACGKGEGYMILAAASQWSESKGWGAFLRLAERLDGDMRLVIIGRLPQGGVEALSRLPRVTHIEATDSQSELAERYSAADVFVTLSKEESFGKVSAEALACGTPVITVNSTANPELVGRDCGLVIEDTEPDTVLGAIGELRHRGKDTMTAACREFALTGFEKRACIRQVYEVYTELLKLKGGSGAC